MSLNSISRVGGGTGTDIHKVRAGHQSRTAQQPELKTGIFCIFFFFMHLFCLSSLMAADLDGLVTLHGSHYCVRSLCFTMLLLTRKVQTTNAWAVCLGGLAKKKKEATINTDL